MPTKSLVNSGSMAEQAIKNKNTTIQRRSIKFYFLGMAKIWKNNESLNK
jgi:hypothetical protein